MKKQNKNKFLRSLRKHFSMVPAKRGKMLSSDSESRAGGASAREKIYFCFVFSFLIFYFLFSVSVLAQFNLPNINDVKPTISLSADPSTPLPNSTITITANISGSMGSNSNYIWFLNGIKQNEASGLNKNVFAFKTGAIGAVYRVSVGAQTQSGEFSDTLSLTVSDVDLTWTANSQSPAAYRAKLMPTQNSIVIVSALPFIYKPGTKSLISSSNLIYNWIIDGKLDPGKSGINKSSYIFGANNLFGNSYLIRLEIRTADNSAYLNKYVTVPVVKPQVLLYFSDSKTGQPYGIALKNLALKPGNLNFAAQTYFFNVAKNNLKWQWFINNSEINPPAGGEKPWLAALNLANNFSGQLSAQIRVTAQNTDNQLESAESTTNLEIR